MDGSAGSAPPAPVVSEAAPPVPVAETLVEVPRRRTGGNKRKSSAAASSSSAPPPKRQAKERNYPLHLLFPAHNGPITRARQSPNKLAAAAVPQKAPDHAAATTWSRDAVQGGASAGGDPIKLEEEDEAAMAEEPLVDADFETVRSRSASVHAVPTPAGWFSWKTIHSVERHMLPSFFSGKSEKRTPEVYMEIRNSIVRKFHADPQKPVEVKDFEDICIGDMEIKQEIMEFLDHWGLINFHPFPPSKADNNKLDADNGANTSSLVEKLYQFETIHPLPRITPMKDEPLLVPSITASLLPESSLVDELARPVGPSVEYHCNSCSGDCSRKRYHCQKQADFDLCSDCYNDRKFDSGMAPSDFILMESADIPGASGGNWTDQETLLLLEALELFAENWNEIAEHVATKTKAQCILHFLQMPIEDSFLEHDDDTSSNNKDSKDPVSNTESANKDPVTNTESANPSLPEPMQSEEKEEKEVKEEKEEANVENALETDKVDIVDQTTTSKDDASVCKSVPDNETIHVTGASIAIDALKSAFQAIGCSPVHEGLGSFADAGNPVMALAAFLVNLIESDVANTSCRSSLRAVSEDSPAIQLATRHCFLLEDPPSDVKDQPDETKDQPNEVKDPSSCVSSATDNGNEKAQKDQNHLASNGTCNSKKSDGKIEDVSQVENTVLTSLPKGTSKEINGMGLALEAMPKTNEDPLDKSKDDSDSALPVDLRLSGVKDTGESSSERKHGKKETKKSEHGEEKTPSSLADQDDIGTNDNVQEHPKDTSARAADSVDTVVEVQEFQLKPGTVSTNESKRETDDGMKESSNIVDKTDNSVGTNDDNNIQWLKRAATSALSAAAVKAKLLAKQEEDEIMKLVSLIIEKQLQKVEAKVSVFSDIENVTNKVREQIERTRQRLVHERSQIIAARMGAPASSLRAHQASVSANRMAMGYGTAGLKSVNMPSQRSPPLRRH